MNIKSYTDILQSRKLAEILPLESADMYWDYDVQKHEYYPMIMDEQFDDFCIRAWSLAALLKYLSEIKPQEYTFTLSVSEGKWCLGCVVYGRGYIRDEFNDNPVDACVAMIIKLNEQKLL